jgi:ribonuclease Z
MVPFSVTILGSSSAMPTSNRFPTSQVVNLNERLFLIDCGEGTQIQLRKFGVKVGRINHIFISHLHGDHIFGLPGLISSLALNGKKGELHIHSHSELQPMMDGFMKYMNDFADLKVIYHPLNFRRRSVVFEDSKIKVESFPLKHRVPCCGFIFREIPLGLHLRSDVLERYHVPLNLRGAIKNGADLVLPDSTVIMNSELTLPSYLPRSYAFCTDTIYKKEIIPVIQDVDLLYHEATFADDLKDLARKTFHTTSKQAALIARKSNAGKLLIGHFSSRYKNVDHLVEEAREIFPATFAANDGERFEIPVKEAKPEIPDINNEIKG